MFYHVCPKLTTYFVLFGLTGQSATATRTLPAQYSKNGDLLAALCSCGFQACCCLHASRRTESNRPEPGLLPPTKKLDPKASPSVLARVIGSLAILEETPEQSFCVSRNAENVASRWRVSGLERCAHRCATGATQCGSIHRRTSDRSEVSLSLRVEGAAWLEARNHGDLPREEEGVPPGASPKTIAATLLVAIVQRALAWARKHARPLCFHVQNTVSSSICGCFQYDSGSWQP